MTIDFLDIELNLCLNLLGSMRSHNSEANDVPDADSPPTFQSGILMKPKQKLFATMDKASGTSPRDNLEVMDLGFFILPNALLAFGLGCSLLAFIVEYFYFHGTAAPISQSQKMNKM